MNILKYELWENIPGTTNTKPYIKHYIPEKPKTRGAVLIIPGSGYAHSPSNAPQEGDRVAQYLCNLEINTFVLEYRVAPDFYPLPLLDGRRAMRFIRYNSEKFGIDKNKIATLGYSAGGHLAASLTSYFDKIDFEDIDEIDKECFLPNLQGLCYPVISLDKDLYYTHAGSAESLLDDKYTELKSVLSFENSTTEDTPPTFIWHNFDDTCVSVVNTLKYAENLRKKGTSVEIHIFPHGNHGIGLPVDDRKDYNHNKSWITLYVDWLEYNNFFE